MPSEYPTSVRLPDDVRRAFRKHAKKNRRTLSRQIVFVLSTWLESNPPPETRKKTIEEVLS